MMQNCCCGCQQNCGHCSHFQLQKASAGPLEQELAENIYGGLSLLSSMAPVEEASAEAGTEELDAKTSSHGPSPETLVASWPVAGMRLGWSLLEVHVMKPGLVQEAACSNVVPV